MAETRTNRTLQTREASERKKTWTPPTLLPDPNPEPGYVYRWVRISMVGKADPMNTSAKLREGWEPVKATDHPEVQLHITEDARFRDNIVIGGLLLCKIPVEMAEQRDEYYSHQAEAQMRSVDNNFMRESDSRMPLFRERKSTVTFGSGS